ncbi:MAG: hypothetical protein A2782_03935 [Candidatus Blackburnbacteria bacterium RIFCSPHIGHO2_01_FULL_43_15b]|uniref:Uncharacterized protein n=1 Tax=Candidatus Blackburnbacteria bacterium RIFCSPHIGHO2_01_FULL_43_15b TaxID=1797513 RepID=A0A1G1UYI3_9BACT|nr:MAG: hypothetical protein A2782_03935 [Candidatus Blackburnbacteria bacterium RIFCSPHIGHO2_01_FULL_43_15b]
MVWYSCDYILTEFGGGKRGRTKIPSPQPPPFLPARAFNVRRFGFSELKASRGESVYLVETPDSYLAHVEEGPGTKNLVKALSTKHSAFGKLTHGSKGTQPANNW